MTFMGDNGNQVVLTEDMQNTVIDLLDKSNKVTFTKMRKALHLDANRMFNLEGESRSALNGNATAELMRKPEMFGAVWDTLSLEEQDNIVETLITSDDDSAVLDMLTKYDLSQEQLSDIPAANAKLPSGTSAYCKEFSELLVHKMESTAKSFTEAKDSVIKALCIKPDDSIVNLPFLPYYGKVLTGSTMGANPGAEGNDEKRYGKIANQSNAGGGECVDKAIWQAERNRSGTGTRTKRQPRE